MNLCSRTFAIYNSGTPMEGVYCKYRYNGAIPNTGKLVCYLCGEEMKHQ
jgi:hypothetical protein